MAGIYKLLFDLSLYYSLTGFYLVIFFEEAPFLPGFLALCAAAVLNRLLPKQNFLKSVVLFLPPVVLLFWPGIVPAVHMLPGWLYLIAIIKADRVYMPYEDFRDAFKLGLELMLLMIPAFLLSSRSGAAFTAAVPYLGLMLSTGVCLLRMLRENTSSGIKQGLIMAAFVAACALLTLGQAPQLVMTVLDLFYHYVIRLVLLGIALLFVLLFYGLLEWIIRFLTGLFNQQQSESQMDFLTALEEMGFEEQVVTQNGNLAWVRIVLYVLLAALAIAAVVLLFRKLFGYRPEASASPYTDRSERIAAGKLRRRRSLTRPRDPRLAVRYYYAKFLRECRHRGLNPDPSHTSEEVCRDAAEYFPGADPAQLRAIYVTARYCETGTVSPEEADLAAGAWRALKRTKFPANPS